MEKLSGYREGFVFYKIFAPWLLRTRVFVNWEKLKVDSFLKSYGQKHEF